MLSTVGQVPGYYFLYKYLNSYGTLVLVADKVPRLKNFTIMMLATTGTYDNLNIGTLFHSLFC
jgi:hypothetical protein